MARPGTDFVSWIRSASAWGKLSRPVSGLVRLMKLRAGAIDLAVSRGRTRRVVHEVDIERALGRANALRQRRRAVQRPERGVTLQDAVQGQVHRHHDEAMRPHRRRTMVSACPRLPVMPCCTMATGPACSRLAGAGELARRNGDDDRHRTSATLAGAGLNMVRLRLLDASGAGGRTGAVQNLASTEADRSGWPGGSDSRTAW